MLCPGCSKAAVCALCAFVQSGCGAFRISCGHQSETTRQLVFERTGTKCELLDRRGDPIGERPE